VHVVVDDEASQLLEHQNQPVGQQDLFEVVALVEVGEQRPFEHDSEQHREHDTDDDRDEQVARQRRQRERHVRADHVETAVGEVDDAHDPEDQRETARDEEQQQPVLDPVQQLDQEGVDIHRVRSPPSARSDRSHAPARPRYPTRAPGE